MSLLSQILPTLAFFFAYRLLNLEAAIGITLIIGLLQGIIHWIKRKPMSILQYLSLLWLGILGSATLISKNIWFIKWKPTLFYGSLALVCALSTYLKKTPVIQRLLESHIQLPSTIWHTLNWHCATFFISMSLLNISVAYTCDTDTWVYFKLFGLSGFTLLFAIGQTLYLSRFQIKKHHDHS